MKVDALDTEFIEQAKKDGRSYCRQYMQPVPREPSGGIDFSAMDRRMGDARDTIRKLLKVIDALQALASHSQEGEQG